MANNEKETTKRPVPTFAELSEHDASLILAAISHTLVVANLGSASASALANVLRNAPVEKQKRFKAALTLLAMPEDGKFGGEANEDAFVENMHRLMDIANRLIVVGEEKTSN